MKRGFCLLLIFASCYFLIFSAVKYNMAASTAADVSQPITVIIDAGHGGEDGGATSVSGVLESTINLQIALRMEQLLAFSGIEPMMLRRTDVSVYTGNCETLHEKKVSDLKNRVQTVNSVMNAMLVSVHQNHFSESKYSGAQVFYAGTHGSKELAQEVQSALQLALNQSNRRQSKEASSVYLMNHIECTGILVECGFLSNPEEDRMLQDDTYQLKLTAALCGSISRYLEGTIRHEV